MKTTRRNFWQTTLSSLLALGGSLLVPSSLNIASRASGLRYFRDEHGTEFKVPHQVKAGQPFNIQLRVGNHEKQIIRKIAFLTDWGSRCQFFPADYRSRNMGVAVLEAPEPYSFDGPGSNSFEPSSRVRRFNWVMKHPERGANVNVEDMVTLRVRVAQKGPLLFRVNYRTLWGGKIRTYPHYFTIEVV
jgi:hypothetical protein